MLLPNRHSPWLRLALMLAAAGIFLLGYEWGNRYQRARETPPEISGVLVRPPAAIPGFTLRDPRGRTFDAATLAEGWTLLAFGDLSGASGQLAVQRLVDLYNRVAGSADLQRALRLVLVTTTATPNLARDFAALSPALYVLGGEGSEIERLRAALGASETASANAGTATPAPLYVFAPGGYLVALLPDNEDRPGMAADLEALFQGAHLLLPEEP